MGFASFYLKDPLLIRLFKQDSNNEQKNKYKADWKNTVTMNKKEWMEKIGENLTITQEESTTTITTYYRINKNNRTYNKKKSPRAKYDFNEWNSLY